MASDNSGRDTPSGFASNDEPKTAGQPLSDFLVQLEDYTPTVRMFFFLFISINYST